MHCKGLLKMVCFSGEVNKKKTLPLNKSFSLQYQVIGWGLPSDFGHRSQPGANEDGW
jgi:hypothetical protein